MTKKATATPDALDEQINTTLDSVIDAYNNTIITELIGSEYDYASVDISKLSKQQHVFDVWLALLLTRRMRQTNGYYSRVSK